MDLMLFVPLAIGVVTGLTQAIKAVKALRFPDDAAPILEVALGVGFVVAGVQSGAITTTVAVHSAALFWSVLYGTVVGLSAGGLYTYAKAARDAVAPANP